MNTITKDGLTVTVKPDCDILARYEHELQDDLIKLVGDFNTIIVDFYEVDMIDSSGIGVLISTQNTMAKRHHALRVINVNREIFSMFKTMRLDKHIEIESK